MFTALRKRPVRRRSWLTFGKESMTSRAFSKCMFFMLYYQWNDLSFLIFCPNQLSHVMAVTWFVIGVWATCPWANANELTTPISIWLLRNLMYTITDKYSTCFFYLGLLWLRPPRTLPVGRACRGYQSSAAAVVNPPQPQVDDISGELVFLKSIWKRRRCV